MKTRVIPTQLASLALGLCALCSVSSASDVLVIVKGVVELEKGQGITSGPFASAQVGDPYTYVGALNGPPPGSPMTGTVESRIQFDTFYLEVGGASSTQSYLSMPGVATIGNDEVTPTAPAHDLLVMGHNILEGGLVSVFYVDEVGIDFNSNDVTLLAGTYSQSFQSSRVVIADPVFFNSALECRIDSLEIINRSQLGQTLCPQATPNSTGVPGQLMAEGFDYAFANELQLRGTGLPIGQFSLLVGSKTASAPLAVANSQGLICLGGNVGRFYDQVRPIGSAATAPGVGTVVFQPNLDALPQSSGFIPAMAGETWTFQAWHRDVVGGAVTNNFTTAVSVTLQ